MLHESQSLLNRCPLFDVLQNFWVPRFKTDDQKPATGFFHCPEGLKVGCHPRIAGPSELQGFQFLAKIENPGFAYGEGVIVKKYFFDLGEQLLGTPHLRNHIIAATSAQAMAAHGLRPEAKGT